MLQCKEEVDLESLFKKMKFQSRIQKQYQVKIQLGDLLKERNIKKVILRSILILISLINLNFRKNLANQNLLHHRHQLKEQVKSAISKIFKNMKKVGKFHKNQIIKSFLSKID